MRRSKRAGISLQIEDQHNKEINKPDSATWSLKAINVHQGSLYTSDHHYYGSSYNVTIHWEDGAETFKPLTVMAKADPLTCALYAKAQHGLLDTPGWKSLKDIAAQEVKFTQMVKQTKFLQA